jgi:hypothetical protein
MEGSCDILNKQWRRANKGSSSSLVLGGGGGLTTSHHKEPACYHMSQSYRTWMDSEEQSKERRSSNILERQ